MGTPLPAVEVAGDEVARLGLHQGRILAIGKPEEVQASENVTVRRFLDRQPEETEEQSERFRQWMAGQ